MNNIGTGRKLSAILFADIEGYSSIMQIDEKHGMTILHRYQDSLLKEVEEHQGQIVKSYGDGSLCLFPSILQAVLCAQGVQLRLQQAPTVPLRIGIHIGDVVHLDDDVYGDAVNIASRIESMGVPGSVLVSRSVFDKVKNQTQVKFQTLGRFNFKNISESIEVFALANEGIVVPQPSDFRDRQYTNTKKEASRSFVWPVVGLAAFAIAAVFLWFTMTLEGTTHGGEDISIQDMSDQSQSIAVLAFADMSPDQDQRYFSEGISEEILNLLTSIPDLKVISRTSSFALSGKQSTTAEIGKTLKVSYILDGSVRKSKDAFRISTQLIEAKSETQLWSETYDQPIGDIFKIQDDIAAKVLEQLKVRLVDRSIASKTVNVDAYNLYLEAKQLRDERNSESDKLAEEMIKRSIAIDSTYAPSYAMLSEVIFNGVFSYSRYSIEDGMRFSLAAAERSVALDPNHSLGYIALTTLKRAENDFIAADAYLKKALEIDPENTDVIYEVASYALDLGNMDEAIYYLKKAIDLDPLNYLLRYTLGLHLLWIEDVDGAEKEMGAYLEQNPSSGLGNNFMAQIYMKQGRMEEAFAALEKDTDPYWHPYRKSILYNEVGKKDEARKILQSFIEDYKNEGWTNIAHVYACIGDKNEAFRWLNLGFENGDASLMEVLNYPEFKIMYADPRWDELIEKLNFPAHHGFDRDLQ